MSDKRKPLYWRVGKGRWHEDPIVALHEDTLAGNCPLIARCDKGGPYSQLCAYVGVRGKVQTRRSAPPVADQCARCRAAKAKARKEKQA